MIRCIKPYLDFMLLSAESTSGETDKTGYVVLIIILFLAGTIVAGAVTFFIVKLNIKKAAKKAEKTGEKDKNNR